MLQIIYYYLVLYSANGISSHAWVSPLSCQRHHRAAPAGFHLIPEGVAPLRASGDQDEEIETIFGEWNTMRFGAFECWGVRPLVMKNAFDVESLPVWEELVELACSDNEYEEPVTSRVITHTPGKLDSFEVEFGPFMGARLRNLLDRSTPVVSTLVVNDVDRWIPHVSDWMDERFDFLPRWRRDDAQMSIAPQGGGIGPHVDNYDVFLIQVAGSREWTVGVDPISVAEERAILVPEAEVSIIDFKKTKHKTVKVDLKEGDCLYIPPRFMHSGKSTSKDCTTLSVGCRAPSAADLLARVTDMIVSSTAPTAVQRYHDDYLLDPPVEEQTVAPEVERKMKQYLSPDVRYDMKELLLNAVNDVVENDALFDEIIGKLVTEPKRPVIEYPIPLRALDQESKKELGVWANAEDALDAFLDGEGILRRAEGISFTWSCVGGTYKLYAQGRCFALEVDESAHAMGLLFHEIVNGPPLVYETIEEMEVRISVNVRKFLVELLEEGYIYGSEI